jgi:hypothetical protein
MRHKGVVTLKALGISESRLHSELSFVGEISRFMGALRTPLRLTHSTKLYPLRGG